MNLPEKRRWPRTGCDDAMRYRLGRKEPFYAATIRNSSLDGLYFIGDKAMKNGDLCHILIDKSAEVPSCPPDFKLCSATVKWCSALPRKDQPLFGIGVQLDGWCQSLESTEIQKIFYRCDACEEEVVSCEVCRHDGPLYLCPQCHRRLQEMPDDPLKASVLRCLIGNVV